MWKRLTKESRIIDHNAADGEMVMTRLKTLIGWEWTVLGQGRLWGTVCIICPRHTVHACMPHIVCLCQYAHMQHMQPTVARISQTLSPKPCNDLWLTRHQNRNLISFHLFSYLFNDHFIHPLIFLNHISLSGSWGAGANPSWHWANRQRSTPHCRTDR